MSQMGLPEQVNSEAKGKGSNTQTLHRAEADASTQALLIHHIDLCGAFSLLPTETAEPQARCSQITVTAFGVHTNNTAGLHSPRCFSSSVPAQRLAPPTNLTDSEQKRNLLHEKIKVKLLIMFLWFFIFLFTFWYELIASLDSWEGHKKKKHEYEDGFYLERAVHPLILSYLCVMMILLCV